MAILPGAIVKIVERHKTPRTWDRGFCLHIAVSDGASLFNYFNQSGNPTSHFYVRKSGNTNGMADFEQYVDTKYRAPAQLEGNPTLISLETQGGVGDDLNAGWSATQVERIAWIIAQCKKAHPNLLLKAMPNSLPSSVGVGYHRLGVDPYRVDGGELWSTAYGKVCPGNARMAQIPQIISRAQQIYAGGGDMEFSDNIPDLKDPDGTATQVGEALKRGNYSYFEGPIAGSAMDNRVKVLEGRVEYNTHAMAKYAYEAVTEGGITDPRLDALQTALDGLDSLPPDAAVEQRLTAIEQILANLRTALGNV